MLTESLFVCLLVFFCTENQERTNIELGEVKGIFYVNPAKILSQRAEEGSPQMTTFLYLRLFLHLLVLMRNTRRG